MECWTIDFQFRILHDSSNDLDQNLPFQEALLAQIASYHCFDSVIACCETDNPR
jgi:hypothetical protein